MAIQHFFCWDILTRFYFADLVWRRIISENCFALQIALECLGKLLKIFNHEKFLRILINHGLNDESNRRIKKLKPDTQNPTVLKPRSEFFYAPTLFRCYISPKEQNDYAQQEDPPQHSRRNQLLRVNDLLHRALEESPFKLEEAY